MPSRPPILPRATRPAILLLVLAMAAVPSSALAATLSGFVTDAGSGESVAFATVVVKGDSVSTGGLANGSGYYAIGRLPAGRYAVTFSALGFQAQKDTVEIATGIDLRHDAALVVSPLQMEGVDVTASPEEEEAAIQPGFLALEPRLLRRLPAVGEQDIIRSLQFLPGVQSASDISSGLYIRGGGPDQTLILLDQIPLYNPTHAFGFFSTFNPDAIKDVNLYKGAYPAQYGGRLGSVLDVTNREGNRKEFEGRGGVSLIAARLTLEGPIPKGSWIVSGRRTYLDPILSALRSEENEIPDYYFYDTNLRLNRQVGEADQIVVSGYFGNDDLNLDLDEGSFVKIRWGNTAGTVRYTHVFNPGLFGNFLVAGSRYLSDTELSIFDTPIRFANSLLDVTVKGDLDYHPGGAHVVTGGFLASTYRFEFDQEFNSQELSGLTQTPHSFVFYGQDEWTASALATIRSGLHVRYWSQGARWIAEPRLSVSRLLSDAVRLRVGGGGYHQFLQLVSTEGFSGGDFWVPVDESVDPGRSWQGVAGVEWEASRRYRFTAESYYTGLENLLLYDNDVAVDAGGMQTDEIFKSGGDGHATGLELFAERRTGALTGWIGYTLGWSRRQFVEVNEGKSFPPKYDRRHDVSFVSNWDRGKWSYGAALIYATGQAFTPAGARYTLRNPATGTFLVDDLLLPAERNSARLLPYHRLDLSVTRHGSLFGHPADWYLQIFNAYSRKNEWFVQYDTENPTTEPEVTHQLPLVPTLGVNFEF